MKLTKKQAIRLLNGCKGEGRKIVIVDFQKEDSPKYLLFVVDDIEHASCPGWPAETLEYYDDLEKAKKEINELYNLAEYKPESTEEIEIYSEEKKSEGKI